MRAISNETRFEGLVPFEKPDPRFPFDGYIASKHFVMLEIVRNGNAMDFFLRPTADGRCLFCAGLPYLDLLDLLKDDKVELLKFMSQSPSVSLAMRSSFGKEYDIEKMHFAKIKDFTNPLSDGEAWCIEKLLPVKVSPKVMDEDCHDNDIVTQAFNEAILLANEFYLLYTRYDQSTTNHPWVKNSILKKDTQLIDYILDNDYYSLFLMPRNELSNIFEWRNRQLLDSWLSSPGCCLINNDGIGIKYEVKTYKADRNGAACLLLNVNLLNPSSKHQDYIFFVVLKPQDINVWKPSLIIFNGIGETFQKLVETFSNNLDVEKYVCQNIPFIWLVWYYQQLEAVQVKLENVRRSVITKLGKDIDKLAQRCSVGDDNLSFKSGKKIILGDRWTGLDDVSMLLHAGMLIWKELSQLDARKYRKQRYFDIFKRLLFIGLKINKVIS